MIRTWCAARWYARDFDVEGMALGQVRRVWLAPQCFGDLLTGAGECPLRRRPRDFVDRIRVDFLHASRMQCAPDSNLSARGRATHAWSSESNSACRERAKGFTTVTPLQVKPSWRDVSREGRRDRGRDTILACDARTVHTLLAARGSCRQRSHVGAVKSFLRPPTSLRAHFYNRPFGEPLFSNPAPHGLAWPPQAIAVTSARLQSRRRDRTVFSRRYRPDFTTGFSIVRCPEPLFIVVATCHSVAPRGGPSVPRSIVGL